MAAPLSVSVLDAVSGRSFSDVGLNVESTADDLKRAIASACGVAVRDQILLVGPPYTRLDSKKLLVETITTEKHVCVFDWSKVAASGDESFSVPPLALQPQDIDVPTVAPPPASSQDLGATASPLVRALVDYERQLGFHATQGQAFVSGANARLASITGCAEHIETQCKCLTAALSNLKSHCRTSHAAFTDFLTRYTDTLKDQDRVLANADAALEALRAVPLHEALVTPSRKTLWDCVPADQLQDWATRCDAAQTALKAKLAPLQAEIQSMVEGVEAELAVDAAPSSVRDAVRSSVSEATELVKATAGLAGKLDEDHAAGARQVKATSDSLPSSATQSTDALEACRQLEHLHQRHHAEEIPELMRLDAKLKDSQASVAEVMTSTTGTLLQRLRNLSTLQSTIRDLNNRLAAFKEGAKTQSEAIDELRHVEEMPGAYHACIAEIVRRREFGRMYVSEVESLADKLARCRVAEVRVREKFLRRHGRHLPTDLVPGLNERPPHAEIQARRFDSSLPAIQSVPPRKRTGSGGGGGSGLGLEVEGSMSGGAGGTSRDDVLSGAATPGQLSPAGGPSSRASEASTDSASGSLILPAARGSTSGGSDEFSRDRILRLEYENARLKAELASLRALNGGLAPPVMPAPSSASVSAGSGAGSGAGAGAGAGGGNGSASQGTDDASSDGAGAGSDVSQLRDVLVEIQDRVADINLRTFDDRLLLEPGAGSTALAPAPAARRLSLPGTADGGSEAGGNKKKKNQQQDGAGGGDGDGAGTSASSGAALPVPSSSAGTLSSAAPASSSGAAGAVGAAAGSSTLSSASASASASGSMSSSMAVAALVASTRAAVLQLVRQHEILHSSVGRLQRERQDLAHLADRISFRRFEVGDVALFFPVPLANQKPGRHYLAFNEHAPHRYLADESMAAFRVAGKFPAYVIGRIVEVNPRVVTEDSNPYFLKLGETAYVLTVATVEWGPPPVTPSA